MIRWFRSQWHRLLVRFGLRGELTYKQVVDETFGQHGERIAENVMLHNALMQRLSK